MKKACSMFSPVIALVCTKYIFRYWAHLLTSSKLTLISISFLAPSNIKRAFGALFLAIPYHILLILSQLFSFPKSKTSTTPSHDLKYVATIDLNFSWPAVSQIHNLTYLSWTWMALYLKSMVVMRWSRGA